MRHRRRGRHLNRTPAHRHAACRNLVANLIGRFDSEREYIVTTLAKAKVFRPFAERMITLAKKGYREVQAAGSLAGMSVEEIRLAQRKPQGLDEETRKKAEALAERYNALDEATRGEVHEHLVRAVHYRRRIVEKMHDEDAARKLVMSVAPRYMERAGGYTRILKMSKWRVGDGTDHALFGFVE